MDFWKHMNCRKVHGLETIKSLKKVREFETITRSEKSTWIFVNKFKDIKKFIDFRKCSGISENVNLRKYESILSKSSSILKTSSSIWKIFTHLQKGQNEIIKK